MENKRPKIDIPMSSLDKIIEVLSVLSIVYVIVAIINAWAKLPAVIPTHYNFAGEIDGYGSKSSILFLLPVMLVMYIGFTVLTKYPQIYNYVVEITEKNALTQYSLAKSFMRILKFEIILLFSYINLAIISSALSSKSTLSLWFLPITFIVLFGSIGIYVYKSVSSS